MKTILVAETDMRSWMFDAPRSTIQHRTSNIQHQKTCPAPSPRLKNAAAHKQRSYDFLCEYLSSHPCVECGEDDIRVLEFDHIDPSTKTTDVGHLMENSAGVAKLQKEIDKCRVLCANCHAKHTRMQNNDYRHRYLRGGI